MSEINQQFDTYDQWISHASRWLTRHPDYLDTEHGDTKGWRGYHFTAICFDAKGRLCRNGRDFMRARDDGTFPVRWVWPDQVPLLVDVYVTETSNQFPPEYPNDDAAN